MSTVRAQSFLGSLGVNVRLEYTDGGYANYTNVIKDLAYLGISNVRDGTPYTGGGIPYLNYLTALDAAAKAGIKFDFVVSPGGQSLATSLGQIDNLARAHPGAVLAVEGPNEINNFPITYNGLSGEAAASAFQRDLYTAVKADTNLKGALVYYYTGGAPITSLSGLADVANLHPYPNWGEQPGANIADGFAQLFPIAGSYQKTNTETGYYDEPTNPYGGGVDDTTQAKGDLNILMDGFLDGAGTTYLYQLLSAYADPSGTNIDVGYGLFRQDNSAKPAAVAIHNLTTVLADKGATARTFTVKPLSYSLSGMPASGNAVVLEKSSGAYDLVLWSEPKFWNDSTHTPISVTPTSVTLTTAAHQTVNVYDPLTGTAPVKTMVDLAHFAINVTDHPIVVEITPATVAGLQPVSGPMFATQGSSCLKLYLSANGSAAAQVSVDGQVIFSNQTLTASHTAGTTEAILIQGPYHGHDIAVSFNSGPGGAMFLDAAALNGSLISGASHTFSGSETFHFST